MFPLLIVHQKNSGYSPYKRKSLMDIYRKNGGNTHFIKEMCAAIVQSIRILVEGDHRIFTPFDPACCKWQKEYNKRTAVEPLSGRLYVSFWFENH